MTIREYINDRQGQLLLHFISMAALTVFLLLTGTVTGIVTIVLIVWVTGLAVTLLVVFLKQRAYINELESIMKDLDQKYLFVECVEDSRGIYERKIMALMRKSGKAMIEAVSDAQESQREYREYIESWVHEVKAPITAAMLISRNMGSEARQKIMPELASIECHVERALFYARAKSAERDILIRQTRLFDLVTQAVEKHRALLIQNGIRVELGDLDGVVYSDEKWAAFMLGQLLQNAIRYKSKNPVIKIAGKTAGNEVELTVWDNGIGIPAHEISRIFSRGFTGSNGRLRGGSTGMGLYICQRLAAFLSVKLRADSVEGEGTTMTLTFPAKENLTKM